MPNAPARAPGRFTARCLSGHACWLLPLLLWAALVGLSLWQGLGAIRAHTLETATESARQAFRMVELTRLWNAGHGGVYVPESAHTPPNPYLDLPGRDVVTRDGRRLTLLNPAYMTRQMAALGETTDGAAFHLTSLRPLRPGNRPDPWEARALEAFEEGLAERAELVRETVGGTPRTRFRYMAPLVVKEPCLKCHRQQGYAVGDIRGGISVSRDAGPLFAADRAQTRAMVFKHAAVFALVAALLLLSLLRARGHWRELEAIRRAQSDLIAARTDELRGANRRLRESEAWVRLLLDSTAEGIYALDRGGICVIANAACARLLGYPAPEALVGRGLHPLIHHHDKHGRERPAAQCPVLTVAATGAPVQVYDDVFWRRDGSPVPVDYFAHPMYRDGALVGTVVSFHDIGERKRAEATLARAETQWSSVMAFFDDAVYLLDREQRLVRANRAFYAMLGTGAERSVGRPIAELLHGQGPSVLDCPLCRLQTAGEDAVLTLEADHPSNPAGRPVEATVRVIRGADGEPASFLVSLHDLTHSRRVDEELRLAAGVFESTVEGIMVTDREERIVAVNPAFSAITGYAAAEVRGRTPRLLASGRHPPDFYAAMWQAVAKTGRWSGEVWNRRKDGTVYPQWLTVSAVHDAGGALIRYIGVFADTSEVKRSQARLDFLAHHDPLTELPNRHLLGDRLDHAIAAGRRERRALALLLIDLDGFKYVNESFSHALGDRLLVEAAGRLARIVRSGDTVARLGGDEFGVLLEDLRGPAAAERVARQLLDALAEPFRVDGHELALSASIGIGLYPEDGASAGALLQGADAAMYQAKAHGRNGYRFCSAELTASARERVQLESQLRQAIAKDELRVFYQPQVDLSDGTLVGAEALVRWQHPALGLVPPGRFVPLAEETGLIVPIGEWVLRCACRQAQAWRRQGVALARIAVNVAGPQVRPELVASVRQALADSGLPAACLELEITEGFIMRQADGAIDVLHALKGLGVSIAIDDFGTGYSSLAYLKRLPVDTLKVDQSFVRGLPGDADDAAIVRAVTALARSLGLGVLGEGVESDEQARFLHGEGCRLGQGYLYGRPSPAERFAHRPPRRDGSGGA